MGRYIKLNERQLYKIIKESITSLINETDAAGVGGATNGSGFFNGAPNSNISAAATYDVPFGSPQRKSIYSPKSKKKKSDNGVDMGEALGRHNGKGGSISIPK